MADNRQTFHIGAPRRGEAEFIADVDARLGSLLKHAVQELMTRKTDVLRVFDLSVAQYAAMMALYYVPGQSAAQLARVASVTPQTMTTVLAKLADKQLIERVPSKIHARVLVITLTAAGEKLALQADEKVRAVEQGLGALFTDDERQQFRGLLQRAIAGLDGAASAP
jgi:DNA-binding MarR family transcriptional regulator